MAGVVEEINRVVETNADTSQDLEERVKRVQKAYGSVYPLCKQLPELPTDLQTENDKSQSLEPETKEADQSKDELEKSLEHSESLTATNLKTQLDFGTVDTSEYAKERDAMFAQFREPSEELQKRHALKYVLGKRDYRRFYRRCVHETIREEYEAKGRLTPEETDEVIEVLRKDLEGLPVYETELD